MGDTKKVINIAATTAKILKIRSCILCRNKLCLFGKAYCQECIITKLICNNIFDGEYHEFKKSHKDSLCEICLEKPLVEDSHTDDDDNRSSDDDINSTSDNPNNNSNDDEDDDNDNDNNSVYSFDGSDSDREPYTF